MLPDERGDAVDHRAYILKELFEFVGVHFHEGHVVVLLSLVESLMQGPRVLLRQNTGTDQLLVEKSDHGGVLRVLQALC